jgi:uncharacterized protein YoxC
MNLEHAVALVETLKEIQDCLERAQAAISEITNRLEAIEQRQEKIARLAKSVGEREFL